MSTETNTSEKELHKHNEKGLSKKEHIEERTSSVKSFIPSTDITENNENLVITMDIPGVKKDNITIKLENNILEIEGLMDFEPYKDLKPVYTEYQVGNYARRFTVSNSIDTENIVADLDKGILTLLLPKLPESQPKQIPIG